MSSVCWRHFQLQVYIPESGPAVLDVCNQVGVLDSFHIHAIQGQNDVPWKYIDKE